MYVQIPSKQQKISTESSFSRHMQPWLGKNAVPIGKRLPVFKKIITDFEALNRLTHL